MHRHDDGRLDRTMSAAYIIAILTMSASIIIDWDVSGWLSKTLGLTCVLVWCMGACVHALRYDQKRQGQ